MDGVTLYLSLVSVCGGLANLLVLVVLLRHLRSLRVPEIFILSITLSDFLSCAVGIPLAIHASIAGTWPYCLEGCKAHAFFIYTFGLVSLVHLAIMAFEKYLTIFKHMSKWGNFLSKRGASLIVVGLWVYCLFFTVPPLFGWAAYGLENGNLTCSIKFDSRHPVDISYYVVMYIGGFFIPLGLILYSYYHINKVKHRVAVRKYASNDVNRVAHIRRNVKYAVKLALLIGGYLLSWAPYSVITFLIVLQVELSDQAVYVPSLFAKTSFMYNPFLYLVFFRSFRKKLFVTLTTREYRARRRRKMLLEYFPHLTNESTSTSHTAGAVPLQIRVNVRPDSIPFIVPTGAPLETRL
nr:TPA: opsin [Nematostella vectensis]